MSESRESANTEVGNWYQTTDPPARSCLVSPPRPAHHPGMGTHMNPPATMVWAERAETGERPGL